MHVLNMTSAQLHSMVLGAEESLLSLQLRLETHTQAHIPPLSQELLLETGMSLDPRWPPAQCLPEGLVCGKTENKLSSLSSNRAGILPCNTAPALIFACFNRNSFFLTLLLFVLMKMLEWDFCHLGIQCNLIALFIHLI